jgi:hypothetical protein
MNGKLERIFKEPVMAKSAYNPSIRLEELRLTTKKTCQNSWRPGPRFKPSTSPNTSLKRYRYANPLGGIL